MSNPVSRYFSLAMSPRQAGDRRIGLRAEWVEPIVTAVAVTTAVLIVAIIAVCMGMA